MRRPPHFSDLCSFSLICRASVYIAVCMARAEKATHDEFNGENVSDMAGSGYEQ